MRTLQIEYEETGDGFCFETDATPRIGEEVVVFSNSLRDVIVEIEGTVIKADWSFVTGSDDDITYTVIVRPPNKGLEQPQVNTDSTAKPTRSHRKPMPE